MIFSRTLVQTQSLELDNRRLRLTGIFDSFRLIDGGITSGSAFSAGILELEEVFRTCPVDPWPPVFCFATDGVITSRIDSIGLHRFLIPRALLMFFPQDGAYFFQCFTMNEGLPSRSA